MHNGKSWIKIGPKKWLEEMPWVSDETIKGIKKQLCNRDVLLMKNLNHVFNKKKDEAYQVKWISIKYTKLAKITKIDVRNSCV